MNKDKVENIVSILKKTNNFKPNPKNKQLKLLRFCQLKQFNLIKNTNFYIDVLGIPRAVLKISNSPPILSFKGQSPSQAISSPHVEAAI